MGRRLAAGLALFLLVGIVLLAVRVSLAPISLGPLREYLLDRLNASSSPWRVTSGPARLRLRPGAGLLVLECENLVFARHDGRARLALPRLETRISLWPLLFGRVDLRALRIPDAEVRWTWSAATLGESLRLAISRAASSAPPRAVKPEPSRAVVASARRGRLAELASMLEKIESLSFGRAPGPGRFSRLEALELGHARVVLVERGSSTRWTLPDARLIFARDREGSSLGLEGEVFGRHGRLGELSLDILLETKGRHRRIAMAARGLRIAGLAEAIPDLEPLAGVAMPLDVTIHADAAGRRVLERANLQIEAGPGTLALPPVYHRPRRFEHLAIALSLDVPAARLQLDRFVAAFGSTRMEISGEARLPGADAPPELSYEGSFDGLSISQLVTYWPDALAAPARRWIAEHIDAGNLAGGRMRIRLGREAFESERLPPDTVVLDFSFADLKVRYLPPVPPLKGARGRGRLNLSSLDLELESGHIAHVYTSGTRMRITRLDRPRPQRARIDLSLGGPIGSLLEVLDSPPLGFPARFGLDPESVEGGMRATARLDFPLVKELTLDGVRFRVEGVVADFRYHGFEHDGGALLSSPRLAVRADGDGMEVHGPVRLDGLRAQMRWQEDFTASPGTPSSRFHFQGSADLARLPFFAADIAPHAAGRGELKIDLAGHGFDIAAARVEADLGAADLSIASLGWKKPAGRPARLSFRLSRREEPSAKIEHPPVEGRLWRLADLSFDAGSDHVAGEAEFLLEQRYSAGATEGTASASGPASVSEQTSVLVPRMLRLAPLRLGLTDAVVDADVHSDGQGAPALVAKVRARSFDARGLLGELELGRFSEAPSPIGLVLDLMADSIVGLNGVNFTAVEMSARRDRDSWHVAQLRAADDRGAPIALDLAFSADCDCRRLTLTAEDAGRTLLGLGLFENAREGHLTLQAEMAPAGQKHLTMEGLARIRDVTLVRRAALVKVLEKGRESGLDAYIGEHGIAFREIRLPFRVDGPVVDLSDGRARGAQLGLTLEGQVNRATGEVNLNGLIVPAYALNSLLGKIPILGSIFTGGKGGGLFALSYRITGSISAPDIAVNPLTILTPGILRKPFEGGKGRVSPDVGEKPGAQRKAGGAGQEGEGGGEGDAPSGEGG